MDHEAIIGDAYALRKTNLVPIQIEQHLHMYAILEPTFLDHSGHTVTTDQICQSLTLTAIGPCKRSRPLDVCLNRYDNSASYLLRNNSFLPALDRGGAL